MDDRRRPSSHPNALAAPIEDAQHVRVRYRTMFDHVRDMIFVHNGQGRIIDVNPACCDELGVSRDEIVGKCIQDFDNSTIRVPYAEDGHDWVQVPVGETRKVDGEMVHRSGRSFPIEAQITRYEEQGTDLFVAVVRNVSERKRTETARARYRQELEEEVNARTAELEQTNSDLERARDAAEEASRAKSRFLANMSHELRTPLNAIIGYSEMLQEDADQMEMTDIIKDLGRIHEAGSHLLDIIGNILDLSKIESGKMDVYIEEVDLSSVASSVVATLQPLVEQANNTLDTEGITDLGVIRTDVTKIRQILFNLLSNANKFTTRGKLTLKATRHAKHVTFAIEDTGVGMTDEQLDRLFQPFTQADASTTREYGGTGLGLALSRHLARLLGGDIDVQSKPDVGTVFTVTIRTDDFGQRRQQTTQLLAHPSSDVVAPADDAPTVLVIDDDPDVRLLLGRTLSKEGYRPLLAEDGPSGILLAQKEKPIAITLDVMMPGMDGWEVLKTLKGDAELTDIPVIMLTMLETKGLAAQMGAAGFIRKPVDRRQLVGLLEEYRQKDDPLHALVVDDDPVQRMILARTLMRMGWSVDQADDGRAAFSAIQQRLPALIILDLMMPELDGFEVVEALQGHDTWRHIPVVVMTAKTLGPEDNARLDGASRIVEKGSLGGEQLRNLVDDLMPSTPP